MRIRIREDTKILFAENNDNVINGTKKETTPTTFLLGLCSFPSFSEVQKSLVCLKTSYACSSRSRTSEI